MTEMFMSSKSMNLREACLPYVINIVSMSN